GAPSADCHRCRNRDCTSHRLGDGDTDRCELPSPVQPEVFRRAACPDGAGHRRRWPRGHSHERQGCGECESANPGEIRRRLVRRGLAATAFGFVLIAGSLSAQTIPEGAQANKVQSAYRRTPSVRLDPFRHVSIPHWGRVFATGGSAYNNTLNAEDLWAILYLSGVRMGIPPSRDENLDSLRVGDAMDAIGLVPQGLGLNVSGQGEGSLYLGGPFGRHLSFGIGAGGAAYGAMPLDDDAIALVRDGNGSRQSFSLGASRGGVLATGEAGAHGVIRLGPMGSPDGVRLNLGFGGRYLRPGFYARGRSTALNGGTIRLTGDSVIADIAVEQLRSVGDFRDNLKRGSGVAADFLLRLDWETSGFAIEAMVANIGTVTVPDVERRTLNLTVATNNLDTLFQQKTDPTTGAVTYRPILDTLDFRVQDTSDVKITLPRIVRFTASSWANRILQIDLSAT